MTLSTFNKGWAAVQVAVLVLAVGGAAFPLVVSAEQDNGSQQSHFHDGHDQHVGDNEGNGNDHNDDQDDNDGHDGHVKGSITVCKLLVDSNGAVIDGGSLPSTNFSVALTKGHASVATASFDTPLIFTDSFISVEANDAQCVTYSDLHLGLYDYGQETITPTPGFEIPKYNDQFTVPVNSASDFYTYNQAGNAGNADGTITLTQHRKDRTLVLLNKLQAPPPPTNATVVAVKIVCDNENDLPNWGAGGSAITAHTATDWVNGNEELQIPAHPNCHLQSGWSFEWGNASTTDAGNAFVGPAGNGYTTFGSTDANGVATTTISLSALNGGTEFHLREVLQSLYIPFTFDGASTTPNGNTISAEFYCSNDVLNYDNFDFIRNPVADNTYYCVAFNAPVVTQTPDPTCTEGKHLDNHVCVPNDNGGSGDNSSDSTTTTENHSSGGGGGGGGGCGAGFSWNPNTHSCVQKGGQVLGASCGLYMEQHLRRGSAKNKPDQVTKLQQFLNKKGFGTFTPTGFFGPLTEAAVNAFQKQYSTEILKPWNITSSTGLAYLTTLRQLNNIECPELMLPLPALVPWE